MCFEEIKEDNNGLRFADAEPATTIAVEIMKTYRMCYMAADDAIDVYIGFTQFVIAVDSYAATKPL